MDLSKNAEIAVNLYQFMASVDREMTSTFLGAPYVKHQHVRSIPPRPPQGCRLVGTAWCHVVGLS